MEKSNKEILDELSNTLLYEGYALYPYRRSALKNQKPVPFGVLFPLTYCKHNVHTNNEMQTQCLLVSDDNSSIDILIKFLQLVKVDLYIVDGTGQNAFVQAHQLLIGDELYTCGWQAEAHEILKPDLYIKPLNFGIYAYPFSIDGGKDEVELKDENDKMLGKLVFTRLPLSGLIEIEVNDATGEPNAHVMTLKVKNTTPLLYAENTSRDEAMQSALVSVHTALTTKEGQFISCQNPGDHWGALVKSFKNLNTWPILMDEKGAMLLSSPIILYDQPKINAGSKGNLFDNTEIEEALWLHVNILTDEEKRQMQHDPVTAEALTIAQSLSPEEIMKLHDHLKLK